jgi:hypothetical protein
MSENETRAAFIAAAVVLLVMPMVFVMGLASLMLMMRAAGVVEMGRSMLVISVVWGVVVMAGALLLTMRLIRRSARS